VSEVKHYLSEAGRQTWTEEIGLMVEMHHKVRTYKTDRHPLVELFRKGDLVDCSLLVSSGSAFLLRMSVMSRKRSPIMDFTGFS